MHPPPHPLQPSSCLATPHPSCVLHHLPLLRPPSLPLPSPCSSSFLFFIMCILFLFFFLFFFHFSFFLFLPLPPYSLLFPSSVDLELPLFSSSSCTSPIVPFPHRFLSFPSSFSPFSSFPLFLRIIFFFFLLLLISNFLLFLLFPLCHHEQFFSSSSSFPPP